MASTSEQLATLTNRVAGIANRVSGLSPNPLIYAATGETVFFGCKVTQGSASDDMELALEGEAAGDSANLNPDISATPVYPFEYKNIASLKSGAFFSSDLAATVDAAPSSGLARYDIAYIFVGPTGPGFAIATGTPGTGVKTDFDNNGLVVTPYDPGTDAAIPVGAFPVARVYVEDVFTGIQNDRIADIRNFEGRLKGSPLVWDELTQMQKDEIIDPAVVDAKAVVLADNEEFKRTIRTQHWLGI